MKAIITTLVFLLTIISETSFAIRINSSPVTTTTITLDIDSLTILDNPAQMLAFVDSEEFINDIPFNTSEISSRFLPAINQMPEPEKFINDIPFETSAIASRYIPAKALGICLEEEKYINDIPCDILKIAEIELQKNHQAM
ncbi:MAG TPA: hypothetical protein PLM34_12430 [Lentimicrobium sp.]|nr:hypothetical protein [Lentimicrobium sp.]